MRKSRKLFLSLGLVTTSLTLTPIVMVSCETNQKLKLKRALRKNKKLRAKLQKKNGTKNDFYSYNKLVWAGLEADKKIGGKPIDDIYQVWIDKVWESNKSIKAVIDGVQ